MNTAYRVWDGKEMHYGDDVNLTLFIRDKVWTLYKDSAGLCPDIVASSQDGKSVLMWGTGLKDKRGKDIYEYDIDMIDNEPMIVVRAGGKLGLKFPGDFDYHIDDCIDWEKCDIGGNVYENRVLLEGAENE